MTMQAIRTKIGEGGRVIIPSAFRQNLHLHTGDDIVLHIEDNVIYITTPDGALSKLQAKVKDALAKNEKKTSLVDELITMRRQEIENE